MYYVDASAVRKTRASHRCKQIPLSSTLVEEPCRTHYTLTDGGCPAGVCKDKRIFIVLLLFFMLCYFLSFSFIKYCTYLTFSITCNVCVCVYIYLYTLSQGQEEYTYIYICIYIFTHIIYNIYMYMYDPCEISNFIP